MPPKPSDSPRSRRRRRPTAAATIHDVAAAAGVSVATVSRVLNRKEIVREATTNQVLEAAKSLRYVPNVAARSLSIRRSQTIGIVLPDMHGEFFSEVIRGIDLAARRERYHVLVSGSHSDVAEMVEVLEAMHGRVDGVLVMAPDVAPEALGERLPPELPVVLLNSSDERHRAITIDNYGGAHAMMQHLAELGHERIAFICGPGNNADARDRLRGYRHAMRAHGRDVIRTLEIAGDFTESSGHEAAGRALALEPRPTAIFAANDSMAVGALTALREAGIAVPGEISVVGFDDIPVARYVTPALTTIRVDIAELGRRAFAVLCEAIADPQADRVRRERVRTTLVVRGSSARPQPVNKTRRPPARKPRVREKGEES
jgi:LacI family transcriptional regulator